MRAIKRKDRTTKGKQETRRMKINDTTRKKQATNWGLVTRSKKTH